jgi:hypothetical protein
MLAVQVVEQATLVETQYQVVLVTHLQPHQVKVITVVELRLERQIRDMEVGAVVEQEPLVQQVLPLVVEPEVMDRQQQYLDLL